MTNIYALRYMTSLFEARRSDCYSAINNVLRDLIRNVRRRPCRGIAILLSLWRINKRADRTRNKRDANLTRHGWRTHPIYLRRGEGKCKIRIPTDGSNLRPRAVNTWAASRAERGTGAPDLTILRPRGIPPMEKLRSEYSTLFFWNPWNRSSSRNFRNTPAARPRYVVTCFSRLPRTTSDTSVTYLFINRLCTRHRHVRIRAYVNPEGCWSLYLIQFVWAK